MKKQLQPKPVKAQIKKQTKKGKPEAEEKTSLVVYGATQVKARTIGNVLGESPKPVLQSLHNETVLGKTFQINEIAYGIGQFGNFAVCKILLGGKPESWITSATYVLPQLEKIQNDLPVLVKLNKKGRMYFLDNP